MPPKKDKNDEAAAAESDEDESSDEDMPNLEGGDSAKGKQNRSEKKSRKAIASSG